MALIGVALAVAIVILTSTIKNAFAKSDSVARPATPKKPVKQVITYSSVPLPPEPFEEKTVEEARANALPTEETDLPRHPRFFDPILVFTEAVPERASAYPLADPTGVVVDLKGVPEPLEPVTSAVGEDDRIRAVKRRVTGQGLRYVIRLSTPVKRVEIESEGRVVMVYPVS
jgi:hypothetical protein